MGKAEEIVKQKMNAARRGFTRERAIKILNKENCSETRFVNHQNYHVRLQSWKLAGRQVPEGEDEQKKLLSSLHLKSF